MRQNIPLPPRAARRDNLRHAALGARHVVPYPRAGGQGAVIRAPRGACCAAWRAHLRAVGPTPASLAARRGARHGARRQRAGRRAALAC